MEFTGLLSQIMLLITLMGRIMMIMKRMMRENLSENMMQDSEGEAW